MSGTTTKKGLALGVMVAALCVSPSWAQRRMEALDRGVVALRHGDGQVYVGWRMLGTDPQDVAFNLYRETEGRQPVRLNAGPIQATTDYRDSTADLTKTNAYSVRPVLDGTEQDAGAPFVVPAHAPVQPFISIPLQRPTAEDAVPTHTADDCSVGDLDGDGRYEIVLKWIPNSSGYTRLLDAYRLDGTRLWRIDMGRNAEAEGFTVYDLDGDGKAEVACKTGDGTVDGRGQVIGDPNADWRGSSTHIVRGTEYLSVFDGRTGEVLDTTDYVPTRDPIDGWGGIGGNGNNDSIGNRANKFLSCVAYLDGQRPSLVMCRGVFGRSVLVVWDWKDGRLAKRWVFDSGISYPPYRDASPYSGMGNHNLSVADVDQDGRDEIVYGAMVVDDDGKGLCTSGLRHGDALHVGDLDPCRPGLEVFGPHENEGSVWDKDTPGAAMYGARTGQVIFGVGLGVVVGRGVAADIDPRHPGFENWGGPGGLRDCTGKTISDVTPSSTNFVIWWDADLTRELLDRNHIDKWDWMSNTTNRLLTAEGCSANNGSKAVPCLTADILGDWREEAIWRATDSTALRIYTTTIPAANRMTTLMHDPQYRLSIAWQNVGYNQPPHLSFALDGVAPSQPRPKGTAWRP